MKYFLLFISLFLFTTIKAQLRFSSNFTIANSPVKIQQYGKSTHNFYYKVRFSTEKNSKSRREAICILQVGENISKFFDYNQLRKDSIIFKYNDKSILEAKEVEEFMQYKVLWNNIVVKQNDKIIIQDRFKDFYQYDDVKVKFNWKLQEGSKKILDYECKKATVEFAGRIYTAWYTNDIPISDGPYKFEGLPGLIMEISDSKNEFSFLAIGIGKTPLSIYLRNDDKIFNISKEKFKTVQMSYLENPDFFHGTAMNPDGTQLFVNTRKVDYNIIELE